MAFFSELSWRRGSVIRTPSLSGGLSLKYAYLWLTCDHFAVKVFAIGHPSRPAQPSIPPGLVNE